MRNLKKVLALVLALVMSMSLVTIANAADFTDKADINYKEAVDVMNAIGVIDGLDTGAFNPKGTLTREQAAKIICTMMLGDSAEKLGTSSSSFKDVAVTRWSSPYIEYCASIGIIAGNGDGTFNPTGKLTGHAFAKMLLGALGYKSATEGYTGAGWSIEVAKDAVSAGIDVDGVALSADLTREQAAQMAFQTLEATMVEYATAGSSVVLPDGTQIITSGATASKVENSKDKAGYNGEKDGYQQFCEEHFDKLTKGTGNDSLGRPGDKWSYNKKSIGTYGNAADYTVILDEDVTAKNLPNELRDLTDNKDLTDIGKAAFWMNGDKKDATQALDTGSVVELFCDGDKVQTVVALAYEVNQIDDISTSLTKAQKDDGATCKIKVDGKWYLDIDFTGFNPDTYEEDSYILYVAKDNKILASQLAESVEGKVSGKKGDDVRIDGTYYTVAAGTVNVGDEGTFYLNMAGQIVAMDATVSKSGNYAYIYKVSKDTGLNNEGIEATTWTAYVVLADGTKASYDIDVAATTGSDDSTKYYFDKEKKVEITEAYTGVIAYSINSDEELVYKTAKDTISEQTKLTVNEKKASGTSSSTEFVFAYQDGSKMKTSLATGYKNVDITTADAWTVTNADGDIVYVFVAAENGTVTTDANLAVILDKNAEQIENEDGDTVYVYTVAVDGEETELTFKDEQSFKNGEVVAYEMNGDYAERDTSAQGELVQGKVESATDDYFTVGGKQYNLGGDETIYTITVEYKNEASHNNGYNIVGVTVSEGGKVEKTDDPHNKVVFTLNKGDLDVVFVYECNY